MVAAAGFYVLLRMCEHKNHSKRSYGLRDMKFGRYKDLCVKIVRTRDLFVITHNLGSWCKMVGVEI